MFEQIVLNLTDDIFILLSKTLEVVYFNNGAKMNFPLIDKDIYFEKIFNFTEKDEIERLHIYLDELKNRSIPYVFLLNEKYYELEMKNIYGNILIHLRNFEDSFFINAINSSNISLVLAEPKRQRIVFVNEFFCKFSGYSRDEIIGKNLSMMKADKSDEKEREEIKNAIDQMVPIKRVLKNKKKNGEIFYNKVAISPIFNQYTKRLQFYIGSQNDVTKEILEKSYYKAILDTSSSIIIVTDGKNIKNANKRFFEITGFKNLQDFELNHKSISELFIQKDEKYIMPDMQGVPWNIYIQKHSSKDGLNNLNKVCILDKDKNERIFEIQSSGKILDEVNEVITLTEVTILLKNRKLLEEQTKHASMGEMIAMIAHQWRQPLTTLNTIYSKLYLMKQMGNLSEEEFEKSYEKSKYIIEHLSETINDFRNFFHKDEIFEIVELSKLIKKSCSLLETNLKISGIDLEVEYEDGIENLHLKINVSKITQVLLNLLKNAYDELDKKPIKNKYIKIYSILDSRYLNINVIDNAGGIPLEIINRIFEPYFSTKSNNGTGLGLYMSKIIIEEHLKGFLFVRNLQEGACFTIRVPKKFISE